MVHHQASTSCVPNKNAKRDRMYYFALGTAHLFQPDGESPVFRGLYLCTNRVIVTRISRQNSISCHDYPIYEPSLRGPM